MAKLSLQELIHAIAGAVVDAQDKVQRFQIATVRGYFDENNRPKAVDVRLPSLAQDSAPEDERLVHVPLLSLVGAHLLNIKDVAIEFEVGLGAVDADEADPAPAGATDEAATGAAHRKSLGVDMDASRTRDSGTMARVTLKVETEEPTEGMSRLIQHLNKLI